MGCTSCSQLKIFLGEGENKGWGYLGKRLWGKLKGRWVRIKPGIGIEEMVSTPKEAEE
jgi:hypothetical protein